MNKNLFNHDKFNTWQTCRKKFYYKYIKELELPEFHKDYELGTSLHALIDYKLRDLNTEILIQNADKEISDRWNIIKNHPIINKKVIKTEWSFNTLIPNTDCWMIGRIDAIFYDEETKKFIIADWKTGKFVPKKIDSNFQHKIYLYALYQSKKDLGIDFQPEDLNFQYFNITTEGIEITKIDFSQEKLAEYESNFVRIIKNIKTESEFQKDEICSASNCSYKHLCKS
jgi:hypothetical protein